MAKRRKCITGLQLQARSRHVSADRRRCTGPQFTAPTVRGFCRCVGAAFVYSLRDTRTKFRESRADRWSITASRLSRGLSPKKERFHCHGHRTSHCRRTCPAIPLVNSPGTWPFNCFDGTRGFVTMKRKFYFESIASHPLVVKFAPSLRIGVSDGTREIKIRECG